MIHQITSIQTTCKMGRVLYLFPGKDGVSRVADIRTATGTIRRASLKIYPLPISTIEASVTPLQLEDGSSKAAGMLATNNAIY